MKISFTKHPNSLGETYLEHLASALLYAGTIAAAFVVCLIHAFLPFLFENTGGEMINKLSDSINKRANKSKGKCACATTPRKFKKTSPKKKRNQK